MEDRIGCKFFWCTRHIFLLVFLKKEPQKYVAMSVSTRAGRLKDRELIKVIRAGVPKDDLDSFKVGLAGSQALLMYGNRYRESKPSKFRWLNGLEPNDCDLFVCGPYGRTHPIFEDYVDGVISNIQEAGYDVLRVHSKLSRYIHKSVEVMITDVLVDGLDTKLSFVQCPLSDTVKTAVCSFDLNIVKVVYDFKSGNFVVENEARSMIEDGRMMITERVHRDLVREVNRKDKSGFTFQKLKNTYFRIAKYGIRGFGLVWYDAVMEHFQEALDITVDENDSLLMRGKVVYVQDFGRVD